MSNLFSHSHQRMAGAVKAASTDRKRPLIVLAAFPVVLYLLDVFFHLPPGDGCLYAWVKENAVEIVILVLAALAFAEPSLRGLLGNHAQPISKTVATTSRPHVDGRARPDSPKSSARAAKQRGSQDLQEIHGPRAEECRPQTPPRPERQAPHGLARWNQRIDSAAKANDSAQAERLMAELRASGVQADTTSYNSVIHAWSRKGEQRRAQKWLQEMKANGVPTDTITYNLFMDSCAKANDAEGAEAWFMRMLEDGVDANVVSYSTLVHARAKRGDPAGAEKWLRSMISAGVAPNVVSYNALMHAYSRVGDASSAERLLYEILDLGLRASVTTYTTMIDSCAKCGDTERAELWMDKMIQDPCVEPNVISYSAMIAAYGKKNNAEKAGYWHRRMIEAGVEPNLYSFSAVARPFARAGDWEEVERFKGELLERGLKVNDYFLSAMLDAYVHAKPRQTSKAITAFKEAVADGVTVTEHVFNGLARALGRPQASELVREHCGDEYLEKLVEKLGSEGQPSVRPRPK